MTIDFDRKIEAHKMADSSKEMVEPLIFHIQDLAFGAGVNNESCIGRLWLVNL